MGKFSNIAGSLVVAFGLSAQAAEMPDAAPIKPRDYTNFITTLKSLCQTHDHILIGDTNHDDPRIAELMADKNVLQAIKDCERPLVLEASIEENAGYRALQNIASPLEEASYILTIQENLGLHQSGEWTYGTHEAFSDFIAQKQQEIGWTKDNPGVFSTDFARALHQADNTHAELLHAASLLKEQTFVLDHRTLGMQYENIQNGFAGHHALSPDMFNGNDTMYRLAQAHEDRIYHAAKIDLPLVYVDSRAQDMRDDPEMEKLYQEKIVNTPMITRQDAIDKTILGAAQFNRDIEDRPIYERWNAFMEKSISTSNRDIINNMEELLPGQKTVMLYGFGHMMAAQDFNEMLGADKTAVIYLYPRDDAIGSLYNPVLSIDESDIPEYRYDIATDKMTEIEEGAPSEDAYKSLLSHVITPEEYQQATNALPAELKPYALPYTEFDTNPENNIMTDEFVENAQQYQNGKLSSQHPLTDASVDMPQHPPKLGL